MILKCYIDKYGDQLNKTLKYIKTGPYKDMLCENVILKVETHCGNYVIHIKLQSRFECASRAGNALGFQELTHDEFFSGVHILEEVYEDTKTGLEVRK